jgi:hypothetical protein
MGWSQLAFALAAILWAVLIARWGLKWWEHAPLERFYDPFMFLMLWNFYYAFLAIVTALVVGILFTSKYFFKPMEIWCFCLGCCCSCLVCVALADYPDWPHETQMGAWDEKQMVRKVVWELEMNISGYLCLWLGSRRFFSDMVGFVTDY